MIHITHTPAEGEARTWDVDYDAFTVGDMMDLETFSGRTVAEVEWAVQTGNRSALMLVWLVWRRRDEPEFTLADVREIPWAEVTFKGDPAPTEDETEGKDPADATEDPETPTA